MKVLNGSEAALQAKVDRLVDEIQAQESEITSFYYWLRKQPIEVVQAWRDRP